MNTLAKNFLTKNDITYRELKNRIIAGTIKPGDRINISHFAEQFGVSIIPVREAIKRLQQEGLVKIVPHAGPQVVRFDDKQFCEIADIRNVLEPFAAKLATGRLGIAEIEELEAMVSEMNRASKNMDIERYSTLNTMFHSFIYDRCGNSVLLATINSLWEKSRLSKDVFFIDPNRIHSSTIEHMECLNALKSRDPDLVQEMFSLHKKNGFLIVKHALGVETC